MPQFRRPSEQAKALGYLSDMAQVAEKHDANPDMPGIEPENLVVVMGEIQVHEHYTHGKQKLTPAKVRAVGRLTLLSVGYDRGYWEKGLRLTKLSDLELQELFLQRQDADQTLHDPPNAAEAQSGAVVSKSGA